MSKEQGAGFYRFKIGEFEVASVSDGFLQFDNPKTMIAAGASEEEFQAFMESKFLPSTSAYFQINSLYVNTGKHKVLIDNGMGPYLGPSGGYLPDHLRNLGVAPEEIDSPRPDNPPERNEPRFYLSATADERQVFGGRNGKFNSQAEVTSEPESLSNTSINSATLRGLAI